jgi:serine protease Do
VIGLAITALGLAQGGKIFWHEAGPDPLVNFTAPPSFAPISEKVNPAVVTIYSSKVFKSPFQFGPNEFFFFGPGPRREEGMGSGFLLTSDGYIITNYHVIQGADEIKVAVGEGGKLKYTAKKIGADEKIDVAVLKIEAENLPYVVLGDSDKIKAGDWVVAIGSPFEFSHTLTAGIVSAKGRRLGGAYDDFIQTDASINPGNSGGPLVNMRGEVIGINAMIVSPSMSPIAGSVGIGFAIPINLVKAQLVELKEKGKVAWAWLGIQYQELTPELAESFGLKEAKGALISKVSKGSPAEQGGLKDGDIIIEFGGKAVDDAGDLPMLVSSHSPGEKVIVKILRAGKSEEKIVELGIMPEQRQAEAAPSVKAGNVLGLAVRDLTSVNAEELGYQGLQGVLVVSVSPDSPLNGQVAPDDLITEIDNHAITNTKDFDSTLAKIKPGQMLRMKFRRGAEIFYYAFKLPSK